jgi:hypothetical protein
VGPDKNGSPLARQHALAIACEFKTIYRTTIHDRIIDVSARVVFRYMFNIYE